jgi:hypothetical protein
LEAETVTGNIPGLNEGGTVTVMEVADSTVTALDVSAMEPNDTVVSGWKFIPIMVACPPPLSGDDDGVIARTSGAFGGRTTAKTIPVSCAMVGDVPDESRVAFTQGVLPEE